VFGILKKWNKRVDYLVRAIKSEQRDV